MAEDGKSEETVELAKPEPAAPVQAAPSGKWHASKAVLIVLGVLAAIVVGGLGFAAGYAVGGDDGPHRHRGDHARVEFHDEMMPAPPFRGEMRMPFERAVPLQQEQSPQQPQTSAPAAPTP